MKWTQTCLALSVLVLLGGAARAELIWGYSSNVLPEGGAFSFNSLHAAADSNGISSTPGGGVRFFGAESDTTPPNGNGRIVLGTWQADLSFADAGDISQRYALQFVLTDLASHQSGTLNFEGILEGEFANGRPITNTYQGPTTGSLLLGSNRYTVSLEPAPPVGGFISVGLNPTIFVPFGSGGTTTAYADVTVTPATAPEPSSLVLALLGAGGGLLGWWRRRTH